MRNPLIVGILKETKQYEHRVPLVPSDVEWLINRGISVEVESSSDRFYSDDEFLKAGAGVVRRIKDASLLVGIKEPQVSDLNSNKIYMVFSHTAKGQTHNMPLLNECLNKEITLIDYEQIVDVYGARRVYFGRFAGICGIVDSLNCLGIKLKLKGIENPFTQIRPAHEYGSLKEVKAAVETISDIIKHKGFTEELTPFIVGITGHGNVSRGVQEILDIFNPIEIHPRDMLEFVRYQRDQKQHFYKIVFLREEKFRSKGGRGFYFEEYLKHPDKFESNLDHYIPYINLLMHTAYWDSRYPRLVTRNMISRLAEDDPFRLEMIGDLSCDIEGSIEITHKTTSRQNPVFTYNPANSEFKDGIASEGVSVLAVDNLPSELPGDASADFSGLIRDYVYQIAAHGIIDITNHVAIPAEIRKAVVTQDGNLTKESSYLKKYIT